MVERLTGALQLTTWTSAFTVSEVGDQCSILNNEVIPYDLHFKILILYDNESRWVGSDKGGQVYQARAVIQVRVSGDADQDHRLDGGHTVMVEE